MLGTGLELVQNLSSGLVEQSCAIVITTTPRHQTGTGTCTYFDIKINYYKKKNNGPTHSANSPIIPKTYYSGPFHWSVPEQHLFFPMKMPSPHTKNPLDLAATWVNMNLHKKI